MVPLPFSAFKDSRTSPARNLRYRPTLKVGIVPTLACPYTQDTGTLRISASSCAVIRISAAIASCPYAAFLFQRVQVGGNRASYLLTLFITHHD